MAICIAISSLAALLLILLAVIAIKTASFKSKQTQSHPLVASCPVDIRCGGSAPVRGRTVSNRLQPRRFAGGFCAAYTLP